MDDPCLCCIHTVFTLIIIAALFGVLVCLAKICFLFVHLGL